MLNLFDSAIYLMERGAFINEPIQVGEQMEPVYFYLMIQHTNRKSRSEAD